MRADLTEWSAKDKVQAADLNTNFSNVSKCFGGDGSDGALNVASGTTTIDLGGAAYVIKNYTSINIASGATLAFSNPHTNGTTIVLKSQGNVTIEGDVDLTEMGGQGGTVSGGTSNDGDKGQGTIWYSNPGEAGEPGGQGSNAQGGVGGAALDYVQNISGKMVRISAGAGGGAGGKGQDSGGDIPGGAGGDGAGALIIECAGALDFDAGATIDASGSDGEDGTTSSWGASAGGGGGAGGFVVIIYATLTDNSGTIIYTGGSGGAGAAGSGGSGTTANNRAGAGGGGGGNMTAGDTASNAGLNNSTAGADGGDGGSYVVENTEF